jgi:peptidoglycan/LPS O-acetylase OafA/YrhL
VFFVVSGFLIARIVTREIGGTGTVSLGTFWARRARRLLPALATVVLVVLCVSAVKLSDAEIHDIRAQALGTLFYVANWVFIFAKSNYFTNIGRPSPLLHMWTLSVEEQFYLLLPLVLLATRRVVARRPARAAVIALTGAIASTVWMAVLVSPTGDPTRGYLGSDSHAMGLLVGVALGVLAGSGAVWDSFTRRVHSGTVGARAAALLAVAALVAILVTMRGTSDHTLALYRGGFLVFAVLCAVIIAVLVALPDAPIARWLRAPGLVAIGLRSYSLYLWHWPVRVFLTASSGLDGFSLFAVRLLVSVVLAEFSYRFVERPFRVGKIARRAGSRPAIAYFAALTIAAAVLVATVDAPKLLLPTNLADVPATIPKNPPSAVPSAVPNKVPATLHVDLFGDSTAFVLGIGGVFHAGELGIQVGGDAEIGCSVTTTNRVSQGRVIAPPKSCAGWQARWLTALRKDPHARVALMTGAWEILDQQTPTGVVRFGTSAWTELVRSSVRAALELLTADGRTVSLFEVPCYGAGDANDPLPARRDPLRIAALNQIYADLARAMSKVEIVHWRTLVCPNGRRVESIGGAHLWLSDDQHLSDPGAVVVWRWWLPQLRATPS